MKVKINVSWLTGYEGVVMHLSKADVEAVRMKHPGMSIAQWIRGCIDIDLDDCLSQLEPVLPIRNPAWHADHEEPVEGCELCAEEAGLKDS